MPKLSALDLRCCGSAGIKKKEKNGPERLNGINKETGKPPPHTETGTTCHAASKQASVKFLKPEGDIRDGEYAGVPKAGVPRLEKCGGSVTTGGRGKYLLVEAFFALLINSTLKLVML